ncbi:MAG: N-acetyltransferase family protein [Melioribacteraceae bacterium]
MNKNINGIFDVIENDVQEILNIYNYYIKNTIITFEEVEISLEVMKSRVNQIAEKFPYLVYKENNVVLGFAYISPWKERSAYRYSVESTIYLNNNCVRKGIGTKLYSELINQVKKSELHSVIGGISLPNDASIKLHEKLGFNYLGKFSEVGYKFNNWIDVGYWKLILK